MHQLEGEGDEGTYSMICTQVQCACFMPIELAVTV